MIVERLGNFTLDLLKEKGLRPLDLRAFLHKRGIYKSLRNLESGPTANEIAVVAEFLGERRSRLLQTSSGLADEFGREAFDYSSEAYKSRLDISREAAWEVVSS